MSTIITEFAINSISFDQHFGEIVRNTPDYPTKRDDISEFFDKCGKQHYRLLAYFSTLFKNSTIIDIGTHRGHSALALSYESTNTVISFDIENRLHNPFIKNHKNIRFEYDNLFEKNGQDKWRDTILSSSFIFLDVEPHNGVMEKELYCYLKSIGYTGFVICDDVWYFKEMRDNFWYKINDAHRFDLTLVGHFSGTGVVVMSDQGATDFTAIYGEKTDLSNWTLVTSYFDLTKFHDASQEIRDRDFNYYMSHSLSTLYLPYNLVIYCDEASYPNIHKIRSSETWLSDRTRYIIQSFDKFRFKMPGGIVLKETFADYREKIIENRRIKPYIFDPRNTASYYLFCMSRYIILKETVEINPFGSSHFAWINLCIERMGYSNLVHLEEALSVNREKFSTCYIDYIDPEYIDPKSVRDTAEYFKFGRCSMCSGFFTGNGVYMTIFCDGIIGIFLKYLEEGYGHSDETLYPIVLLNCSEFLFHHYYGDYQQMITNYKYVYESPEAPIYNFIRNSFEKGNYVKCLEACNYINYSIETGKCGLDNDYTRHLKYYMTQCQLEIR